MLRGLNTSPDDVSLASSSSASFEKVNNTNQPPSALPPHNSEPTLADVFSYMKASRAQHSLDMIRGFQNISSEFGYLKKELGELKGLYNECDRKINSNSDEICNLKDSSKVRDEKLDRVVEQLSILEQKVFKNKI